MRREDLYPGLALAAENDVRATFGDHHSAFFTLPSASVNAAHGPLFRYAAR